MSNRTTENRFAEFVQLHKKGIPGKQIAEILGVSRQTISKYSQWLKGDSLENSAKEIERRLADAAKDVKTRPDDIVKLADALVKIRAIQRKNT